MWDDTEHIAKRIPEDRGYCKKSMNKAHVLKESSSSQAEEAFKSTGYRSRHSIVHAILAYK